MSKAWIKDGKVLVDSNGAVILCDECPCEVDDCTTSDTFFRDFTVTDNGDGTYDLNWEFDCGTCDCGSLDAILYREETEIDRQNFGSCQNATGYFQDAPPSTPAYYKAVWQMQRCDPVTEIVYLSSNSSSS